MGDKFGTILKPRSYFFAGRLPALAVLPLAKTRLQLLGAAIKTGGVLKE